MAECPDSLTGAADTVSDEVQVSGEYQIAKADDVQQHVFGWASIAVHADGTPERDAHQDEIDTSDLEAAAYEFTMSAQGSGEDHQGTVDGRLIESVVINAEKAEAMGFDGPTPTGWWVGFHIPDRPAYERAVTEKRMFSIEGTARREEVAA